MDPKFWRALAVAVIASVAGQLIAAEIQRRQSSGNPIF